MAVAGLDLSLRGAGVAVIDDDGRAHTKTFGYSVKNPTAHDEVLRIISIARGIVLFLGEFNLTHVAIEGYAFAGHGLTKLGELGGLVKAQIYLKLKVVVVPIPASSIRAFLIPKPTAKKKKEPGEKKVVVNKKKMVENHLRSLGYTTPKNDNEFDALAVALVMKAYLERNSHEWTKQQSDLLSRIDGQMVKD